MHACAPEIERLVKESCDGPMTMGEWLWRNNAGTIGTRDEVHGKFVVIDGVELDYTWLSCSALYWWAWPLLRYPSPYPEG